MRPPRRIPQRISAIRIARRYKVVPSGVRNRGGHAIRHNDRIVGHSGQEGTGEPQVAAARYLSRTGRVTRPIESLLHGLVEVVDDVLTATAGEPFPRGVTKPEEGSVIAGDMKLLLVASFSAGEARPQMRRNGGAKDRQHTRQPKGPASGQHGRALDAPQNYGK